MYGAYGYADKEEKELKMKIQFPCSKYHTRGCC